MKTTPDDWAYLLELASKPETRAAYKAGAARLAADMAADLQDAVKDIESLRFEVERLEQQAEARMDNTE